MAISKEFIDSLIERSDIVDVVSDYVSLRKQGRNFTGLCPFHSEKTPSFVVSPEKQICNCFGCGNGGTTISFIMKVESLEFPDAVRFLAKKYNMDVPEEHFDKKESQVRQNILKINRETARFFYEQLISPENEHIQKYLADRGINKKLATNFGLGFAPKSFNALQNHLRAKGFYQDDMLKAGVLSKNDKGNVYDKFRNRVMFPIIDIRGNIIAFGGRVTDNSLPKYLNSPETTVYSKSNNLFALNIAKKTKSEYIILAEGYMDVIALHKAGFDCAVASLGTALTEQQARLLTRFTKTVVIAYDSDNAGREATNRAIEILKKVDIDIKVLQMKDAKDPDEFIIKYGKDAFLALLDDSKKDNDYKFINILAKYDLENDTQKLACVTEVVKMISEIPSAIERDLYMHKIAEASKLSKTAVESEVKRYYKKRENKTKKILSPVTAVLPKTKGIAINDIKSAKAEEEIVTLIFTNPEFIGKIDIDENRFSVEVLKRVFIVCKNLHKKNESFSANDFYEILNNDEISYLTGIIAKEISVENLDKAILDYQKVINEQFAIRTRDAKLLAELRSN